MTAVALFAAVGLAMGSIKSAEAASYYSDTAAVFAAGIAVAARVLCATPASAEIYDPKSAEAASAASLSRTDSTKSPLDPHSATGAAAMAVA